VTHHSFYQRKFSICRGDAGSGRRSWRAWRANIRGKPRRWIWRGSGAKRGDGGGGGDRANHGRFGVPNERAHNRVEHIPDPGNGRAPFIRDAADRLRESEMVKIVRRNL